MEFLKPFARSLAMLGALSLLAAPPLIAPVAAKSVPWLYKNSDVPQDKEWVFGTLPNGLRYAVRNNRVPPNQVSIRIRIDAGSLYERDGEEGYAHLLEHLLFRQSKYLEDGQAIPTWQRLGASFGNDTNAETTTTQTVFKLDLPNATPAALDESFKLLSGMVTAPTLSEANIRTDVPIVLAEMRERGGTGQRVQDATRRIFYKGQPLAERAPIGTVESLEGAHQEAVRAFYKRWYRPENAVIVVAGDAPTAELEALVRKWFVDWKGHGRPEPAPSFGDPLAPPGAQADTPAGATPVGATEVLVEPDLPRSVNFAILRPWRQVNDTIVYNQGLMIDALAQALINRRLEAKARAGGSYLVADVSQDDVSRSIDGTFVSVTPLSKDWQAALKDVRAVIADAVDTPPSQAEIDREIAELEVAFQVPVEQRRLLPGSKLADDLVKAVDIRETVAAPEVVLNVFRESIPLYTPANLLEHTRALFRGNVTRAILITPKSGEGDAAGLQQALRATVAPDSSVRLANSKPVRFEDMPAIGKPGEISRFASTGLLGIDQLEFANGVKALLWPVKEEPGRVAVKVRFGGGYRSFAPDDAAYIALGDMALVGAGVGSLDQEQLDRIATGRKMGFDFEIDDAAFEFSADTRPSDLADQLYLFAAKFATPRWDTNPVLRAKAAAEMQYEAYQTSPNGVLNRDLNYLQSNKDPRYRTPTPAEIEQTTPEGFRKVWQRALEQGPIEVQVYGDFDRDAVVSVLQRTFGALPPRQPLAPVSASTGASFPAPTAQPVVLTHRGEANQAAAVISWPTGGGSSGISESRQLQILTQLFSNRLMDAMREKAGASYAPQVYSKWPLDTQSGGSITAMAQLAPAAVPIFFETAQKIAADLIANPPGADELARVTEPLRQQVTRAATSSAYFMYQIEGATSDPARIDAVRTLLPDYTETTPERMQVLAKQFLQPSKSWKLAVLPEGQATSHTAAAR